jgi:hypothetical protein
MLMSAFRPPALLEAEGSPLLGMAAMILPVCADTGQYLLKLRACRTGPQS